VTPASAVLGFDIKTFHFTWTDMPSTSFYCLLEKPDESSDFSQLGTDISRSTQAYGQTMPLYKRFNASYILQSSNIADYTDRSPSL
jgi:hypothetical protein